jgi:cytochrome c553
MKHAMTMSPLAIAAILVALAAGVVSGSARAADLAAGKAKADEVCKACHGADGNNPTPDFPKLGGQYPDYLAKALRDYKSGERKNPIMAGFAKTLSKQDIENLSAYYASQTQVVLPKH